MRLQAWESADRSYEFGLIEHLSNRVAELIAELFSVSSEIARHPVPFEILPEPFDRIHVRAVGRQKHGLDVMPIQPLGLVPTGIVQNQTDSLALIGMLLGHRIQEGLKHLRITMRNDQADEPPGSGTDRADDVSSNVTSVIALGRATASFDPALSRSWVSFKPGFVTKEDVHLRVFQQLQ